MPKRVEKCVRQLKNKGFTEEEAWAICKSRNSEDGESEEQTDDQEGITE